MENGFDGKADICSECAFILNEKTKLEQCFATNCTRTTTTLVRQKDNKIKLNGDCQYFVFLLLSFSKLKFAITIIQHFNTFYLRYIYVVISLLRTKRYLFLEYRSIFILNVIVLCSPTNAQLNPNLKMLMISLVLNIHKVTRVIYYTIFMENFVT